MKDIWVLSYTNGSLEQWFFSCEKNARKAMNDLLPGRIESDFRITKQPINEGIEKVTRVRTDPLDQLFQFLREEQR